MKKLKIFLPSIALIVVLAFSITIGVYAASNPTLTVTGSISFKSPDIGAAINCYINYDSEKADNTVMHTWDNVDADTGEIRADGVAGYTEAWNLNAEKNAQKLTFTGTDGQNSTLTLDFKISNKNNIKIYAYLADATTGEPITVAKNFNGTKGTENLVTATASSYIEIDAGSKETPTEASSMLSITFTLNSSSVIRKEGVDISTLGWQVRLSKFAPTTSQE